MFRSALMRSIAPFKSAAGYAVPANIARAVDFASTELGFLSWDFGFTVSFSMAHMGRVSNLSNLLFAISMRS